MHRCLELASLGAGYVAPNPLVGAVLVHHENIIGEGYHKKFGEAHAEVNCINSVKPGDENLISQSVLYVSLEPCSHFGKTPPCTGLIIKNKIPKVVIACQDPFNEVNGKGIEQLSAAGVEVETGVLEKESKDLNKRFFTFHKYLRPYIILKWAQSSDKKIAPLNPQPAGGGTFENTKSSRLFISNENTNRLVHKWRSKETAILVGTNTALLDDPELTTRLWPGPSPTRLVVDLNLRLPNHLKVFNKKQRTIIFNYRKDGSIENLEYYRLNQDESVVKQIIHALYKLKIQSVLVEGGSRLLQSFIDEGLWDEARIITNKELVIKDGLSAPSFPQLTPGKEMSILNDKIYFYQNTQQ
jgi:diaminohydroxyphosphoribosylaminopyrimidine deaminase/5-amino-6-(5-phosphoribosylamino)uracil reductase